MTEIRDTGSIWRRWDVHLHTPGTLQADEFGSWEEYVDGLEAQSEVVALGITDYLSIRNYKQLLDEKHKGRLANVALLFPNIEFRISPATKNGKGINIHLLVSPDDPKHVELIKEALARLAFSYGNTHNYYCSETSLIALGRAFDSKLIDDESALREGVNQFKVSFEAFRDWLGKQNWLRRHSIVAVDAGEKDGAAGLQHDDGFKALREEIYAFADVIFSPRPKDRDYWLGKSHDGEAIKKYGAPKPCLHGCDAHSMERLLKPDNKRYCWIKADPTFEGLRQVIFEPEERVSIGEIAPDLHDRSRTLASITISNSNGWFEQETLPLNPGLIAVIGRKGMGKSALNELIAYAAGDWAEGDSNSFISRARPLLKGTTIRLEWCDGQSSEAMLAPKYVSAQKPLVRYLSQRFVERLCADPKGDSDLVREIESVVFAHLMPSESLNASSFTDLREKKTASVRTEQRRLIGEIKRLHREIDESFVRQLSLPDRRARKEALQRDAKALLEQAPSLATPEEVEAAELLKSEHAALTRAVSIQAGYKEKLLRVDGVKQKIKAFRAEMARFYDGITSDLREIDVSPAEHAAFRPAFMGDVDSPLNAQTNKLYTAINALEGEDTKPATGTIKAHQAKIKELGEKVTADQAKQQRFAEIQTKLASIDQEINRIDKEVAAIEGSEAAKLASLREQRRAAYVDYFETLKQEHDILAQLYKPLQEQFGVDEEERQVQFQIKWHVDVDAWIDRGMHLFDQRKNLPYHSEEDMREAAMTHLVAGWEGGSSDLLRAGLDAFLQPFPLQGEGVQGILRGNFTPNDFFDWLYSVDHISLVYGMSYQGTSLEKLSPGTKGIVLLMLYLAMDSEDKRPLLIDQPDENLDNESIFQMLATYFRRAKIRRQILLITHNPNLVVNTDAEQIIVANCEKRDDGTPEITYISGGIEDASSPDGIRQIVCRVLEGGEIAFQKREKRYALHAR